MNLGAIAAADPDGDGVLTVEASGPGTADKPFIKPGSTPTVGDADGDGINKAADPLNPQTGEDLNDNDYRIGAKKVGGERN